MKQKKIIIALCIVVVLLIVGIILFATGVFDKKEEVVEPEPTPEPTPEITPEPEPTEPAWEPGIIRGTYAFAQYAVMSRGDAVEVIGELEDFYVIAGEETDLMIEKRFVRLQSDEVFEETDGYAKAKTKVYESAYLDDELIPVIKKNTEPIAELAQNTKLHVLDSKDGWMLVEWADGTGYISDSQYSKTEIKKKSGGGGGGSSSGPQDGGDIVLSAKAGGAAYAVLGAYFGPQYPEFEKCSGTVLAEGTEAYIYLYERDETAKVTNVGEETCTVYIEGFFAEIRRALVKMEGDEDYAAWDGFAQSNAVVYTTVQKWHDQKTLDMNTNVKVLDELENCFVVEVDGEIGYMDIDSVSEEEIVKKPSGGGGGSSGGGGGGGGGGEWTPPAL